MKTVVILLMMTIMLAIQASPASAMDVHPDYPGLDDNGGVSHVGMQDIQSAVHAFCKVYGRLPGSWNEVKQSGLFTKDILGFNLEIVDPDVPRTDFNGDMYLDAGSIDNSEAILLFYLVTANGNNSPVRKRIDASRSYAERFETIKSQLDLSASDLQLIEDWKSDESQLIQFGHIHQFHTALLNFRSQFGYFPATLNDLVANGFGPLSPGSMNPVTGEAYRFDGSQGDIFYELAEEGSGFRLGHAGDGEEPGFFFSY